ncbi:universal stress protein [Salinarchaeum laminariae]|uniref:universal stress protein n=1 Tax=Salinarchaeum laminariae TaxID=869888 RepID=UPI0020C1520C|nr:universal stress protein [Salinarchaeum laminariae]
MYDSILIATDGSEPATAAAQHAVDLAAATGATVHALFVVDTDTGWLTVSKADVKDSIREIGEGASREALQQVERFATEADVQLATAVREGAPEAEVLAYAEEADVDLVVLGTHGHSALKRRLLGSVAERVINGASVPVTTIGVAAGDQPSTQEPSNDDS